MLHEPVCLTIPKKIIEIRDNSVIVETHNGDRQELKSMVELAIGDFVISQQNIVLEKIDKNEAQEIFNMINTKGEI